MTGVPHIQLKKWKPITREEVVDLVSILDADSHTSQVHTMLHASICLAFASSLRISQFTYSAQQREEPDPSQWHLTLSSVVLFDDRLELNFTEPKTGLAIKIEIAAVSDEACAVAAIRRVLRYPGHEPSPLFELSSGKGFPFSAVIHFLRGRLEILGHDFCCDGYGICTWNDSIETTMRRWNMDIHRLFLDVDPGSFFVNSNIFSVGRCRFVN